MATPRVIQPHPRGRGWTFKQHRDHVNPATGRPYLGGDDFERRAGASVASPCWSDAERAGVGVLKLTPVQGGRPIYVRELGRLNGHYPRRVDTGETIAFAGPKWPHYDTTDALGRRASIMARVAAWTKAEAVEEQKKAARALNRKVAGFLNDNGFTVFDSKTEKSGVRDLRYWRGIQRSAGIRPTGTIGKRTLAAQRTLQRQFDE